LWLLAGGDALFDLGDVDRLSRVEIAHLVRVRGRVRVRVRVGARGGLGLGLG
jgi:hypothetical protein